MRAFSRINIYSAVEPTPISAAVVYFIYGLFSWDLHRRAVAPWSIGKNKKEEKIETTRETRV